MKKILFLILALPVLAVSCENRKEPVPGTMKGVFYADIPGEKELIELAPDASRTYNLRACAQGDNVADVVVNFTSRPIPTWWTRSMRRTAPLTGCAPVRPTSS